eukprot:gnl/MRDRNA2_/MRDRNA2_29836_c0_seq1.p1 gnl/MRDRNA2_/MRDRNA2_29836_c0~~gnl/MRDRNA2_/MRDRNA2_29836_c0_seq1.p1  ORF type:complete len:750 (-),score=118.74 gnl/MRDRNA2_/MRDRNA2_29836_c0_seq1:197-2446(-)
MVFGAAVAKKPSKQSIIQRDSAVVTALRNMICPLRLGEFSSVSPQVEEANQQLAKPLVPAGSRVAKYMESRPRSRSERSAGVHRFTVSSRVQARRGTQGRIQDLAELGDGIEDMESQITNIRNTHKAFGTSLAGIMNIRQRQGGDVDEVAQYVQETTDLTASSPSRQVTQRKTARTQPAFQPEEPKYDDLEGSIHDSRQVCALTSERRRVEKKIEYYRETGPLEIQVPIEKRFMVVDPVRNAEVVDVVRLNRIHGNEQFRSQSPRSKSPRSKSPPFTKSAITQETTLINFHPKFVADRMRECAEQNAQRMQHALRCARDAALEKRVKAWRSLDWKDRRRDICSGQRLWLMSFVVASVAREMEHTLKLCQQLRSEAETFKSPRASRLKKLATAMMVQNDEKKSTKISSVLDLVSRQYKESRQLLYKKQLTKSWWHILRVCKAYALFRKPLRLNAQAEIMKRFINDSYRGYTFRRDIKKFLAQIRFLQRGMRSSIIFAHLVRKSVIVPAIWEQETRILGEVMGLSADSINELIAHQMEHVFEVERHKGEIKKLNDNRHLLWRGNINQDDLKKMIEQDQKRKQGRRGSKSRLKSKFGGLGVRTKGAGSTPPASPGNTPPGSPRTSKSQDVKKPSQNDKKGKFGTKNSMGEVINTYRLPEERKTELVRQVWKENQERWWKAYQQYKALCKESVIEWHAWFLSARAIGTEHQDIWPPMPLIPGFPHEMARVDRNYVRSRVQKLLRQSSAGVLLR